MVPQAGFPQPGQPTVPQAGFPQPGVPQPQMMAQPQFGQPQFGQMPQNYAQPLATGAPQQPGLHPGMPGMVGGADATAVAQLPRPGQNGAQDGNAGADVAAAQA